MYLKSASEVVLKKGYFQPKTNGSWSETLKCRKSKITNKPFIFQHRSAMQHALRKKMTFSEYLSNGTHEILLQSLKRFDKLQINFVWRGELAYKLRFLVICSFRLFPIVACISFFRIYSECINEFKDIPREKYAGNIILKLSHSKPRV